MEIKTDLDKIIASWTVKKIKQFSNIEKIQAGVSNTQKYDEKTYVYKVFLANEFGTESIPPRPAMRLTISKYLKDWYNIFIAEAQLNKTLIQISKTIGVVMKSNLVKSIDSDIQPPNSERTLEAYSRYLEHKYKSKKALQSYKNKKTLIFTGTLRNSIIYKVFKKVK